MELIIDKEPSNLECQYSSKLFPEYPGLAAQTKCAERIKLWTVEGKTRICQLCLTTAEDDYQIRKHLIDIHPVQYTDFVCKARPKFSPCQNLKGRKRTQNQRVARPKLRTQNQQVARPKLWTIASDESLICKICLLATKNNYQIKKHLIEEHAAQYKSRFPDLVCKECSQSFTGRQNLERHKCSQNPLLMTGKLWTNMGKSFVCRLCPVVAKNDYRIRQHLVDEHPVQYLRKYPNLLCSNCSKLFSRQDRLERHKCSPKPWTTNGNGLYSCSLCAKAKELNKYQVLEHCRKDHSAHYRKLYPNRSCKDCGQLFIKSIELKKHEKDCCDNSAVAQRKRKRSERAKYIKLLQPACAKENRPATYQCACCLKKFSGVGNYQGRLKKHLREKHLTEYIELYPHLICPACGHVALQPSHLKAHMQRHSGTTSPDLPTLESQDIDILKKVVASSESILLSASQPFNPSSGINNVTSREPLTEHLVLEESCYLTHDEIESLMPLFNETDLDLPGSELSPSPYSREMQQDIAESSIEELLKLLEQ